MAEKTEAPAGTEIGDKAPRSRPPQDPEAFARWLGLETLKADLKRLELERLRYAREQQNERQPLAEAPAARPARGALALGIVALALVLLLAGLAGYLAVRLGALNAEVARLSMAQADLKDALEAVDAQLSAAAQPAPAAALSSGSSQLTWSPPPGVSSRTVVPESIPASAPAATPPAAVPAADPAEDPATAPAAQADAFSVRVFGSANANLKNRMEAFAGVVKAAGFKVEVSSNDVFQPLANTISYHVSAAAKAEELARALKAKYPKLNFEMKLSEAITDSMRRIIIVNLTDEALN